MILLKMHSNSIQIIATIIWEESSWWAHWAKCFYFLHGFAHTVVSGLLMTRSSTLRWTLPALWQGHSTKVRHNISFCLMSIIRLWHDIFLFHLHPSLLYPAPSRFMPSSSLTITVTYTYKRMNIINSTCWVHWVLCACMFPGINQGWITNWEA